jgi:CIC family chloride channel protein
MAWQRVLAVKVLGGFAGIGAGLALGREGPTIQMGAAAGQMVSGWFPCTPRERRTLIAAGAGAGLAAAFNAPLAGLVFVLEEVQRDFSPGVFTATLIAAGVADVTTCLLIG